VYNRLVDFLADYNQALFDRFREVARPRNLVVLAVVTAVLVAIRLFL
jgi:hypothetical protein